MKWNPILIQISAWTVGKKKKKQNWFTGYEPKRTTSHFRKKNKQKFKQETGNGFTYSIKIFVHWDLLPQDVLMKNEKIFY